MTTFCVCWRIDIEADSPLEAVHMAKQIQLDVDSTANVFEVYTHDGKGGYNEFNDIDLDQQA